METRLGGDPSPGDESRRQIDAHRSRLPQPTAGRDGTGSGVGAGRCPPYPPPTPAGHPHRQTDRPRPMAVRAAGTSGGEGELCRPPSRRTPPPLWDGSRLWGLPSGDGLQPSPHSASRLSPAGGHPAPAACFGRGNNRFEAGEAEAGRPSPSSGGRGATGQGRASSPPGLWREAAGSAVPGQGPAGDSVPRKGRDRDSTGKSCVEMVMGEAVWGRDSSLCRLGSTVLKNGLVRGRCNKGQKLYLVMNDLTYLIYWRLTGGTQRALPLKENA